MKVLLDACVWGGVARELEAAGHDVVWAGNWQEDPGDAQLLARADREGRILVTLDKDFGEWAILRRAQHCGILRLVDCGARQQASVCVHVLALHGEALLAGSIVTAEPDRLTRIIHEAARDFTNNTPFGLRREALACLLLRVSLEQVRSTVSKPAQAQQALVQALMSENVFSANNLG